MFALFLVWYFYEVTEEINVIFVALVQGHNYSTLITLLTPAMLGE